MRPLRRHMIDEMQIRNLTPNTQRVYIEQVARFARYFHKSPGARRNPIDRANRRKVARTVG
jgi:hypothetical protein